LIFGDENMAVFSIIKLSELEGAKRIDAELYQPQYLNIRHALAKIRHTKIGEIVQRCKKGIFDIKAEKYVSVGVPFIRISNLKNGLIDDSDLTFIPLAIHKKEIRTEFHRNDIVLSKTAYPAASIIFFEYCNISQDIVGISLKDSWKAKLAPAYVVAFLNSKYGLSEMQQWFQGNIQMHLALPDVRRITIPILSENIQKKISEVYINSHEQNRKSKSLYFQAETLLLEELGFKDFKPKYEKTYTAKLSFAFSAHRIDAEYFQPAYEEVVRKIKEYPNGFAKLLKHAENVKPDFDPTKYPDDNFSYVELADIDSSIGIIHSVNRVKGKEAPSRARRLLKEGDVIVSSVEGSLEKVALIDKEHDACLASTGFFQFRPLDILPEVLLVLSKTIVLQSQLKKKCSGTILTAVPKESLRDIVIPILPLSTQQKIASLVQQSHEARKKAKELLEVAKRAVEIAIEKNEKEALDYISKA
jgi:restriction endonuclease S subunit